MKRMWLKKNRHRIRNWRSEWRKSYDMSAAGNVYAPCGRHKCPNPNRCAELVGNGSVRLRMVNRNLVIPEQVNDIAKEFQIFF